MNAIADKELLAAAVIGYQAQLKAIDEKIREIRSELGGSGQVAVISDRVTPAPTGKRTMSPDAKARIAAAQKKRWAAYHKEQSPDSAVEKAPTKKKRKLSAAGRAAIVAATKKRWAAARAVKAA